MRGRGSLSTARFCLLSQGAVRLGSCFVMWHRRISCLILILLFKSEVDFVRLADFAYIKEMAFRCEKVRMRKPFLFETRSLHSSKHQPTLKGPATRTLLMFLLFYPVFCQCGLDTQSVSIASCLMQAGRALSGCRFAGRAGWSQPCLIR